MDVKGVKSFILSLVVQYVQRQVVVRDIIAQLRPDMLLTSEKDFVIEDVIRLRLLYADAPQNGTWGEHNEWTYTFHGNGCKLIHTHSAEPLEWDTLDIEAFDVYWFNHYFLWWLDQDENKFTAAEIKRYIDSTKGDLQSFAVRTVWDLQRLNKLCAIHSSNPNKLVIVR